MKMNGEADSVAAIVVDVVPDFGANFSCGGRRRATIEKVSQLIARSPVSVKWSCHCH